MNRKIRLLTLAMLMISSFGWSQKYFTRNADVKFFSEAPAENIEAQNRQVTCVLNTENGEIAFSVQMKGFHFEKALMEEHFNENYVESHKYPKATFAGKIMDFNKVDISKNGTYKVKVEGTMTLHGVEKQMDADGELTIKGEEIIVSSKFDMKIADYNIAIPNAVVDKIAEVIEVSLDATLTKYTKN
ncbi:MAG: YceI family protein [Cyclobacteriaceae bacterium]|nr:YceI family protein [Cyclobacteriaceae bacterium]